MDCTERTLQQVVAGLEIRHFVGDPTVVVSGVQSDSRRIKPGNLFVALPGLKVDGHRFITDAVNRGAVAVVAGVPVELGVLKAAVQVTTPREALAFCSGNFWGHPSLHLHLIGITGTNGKTTLTYLIENLLRAAGAVPGVIGTINVRFGTKGWESSHTTPESSDLQDWLSQMREEGVTHVAMEVSSHALDLQRVRGCHFQVAVFTNLSRDHLDYHGDLDRYAEAKSLLFSRELAESRAQSKVAVINADDPRASSMIRNWKGPVVTFGLDSRADVHPVGTIEEHIDGVSADVVTPQGPLRLQSGLPGRHNLFNLLAAAAVGRALGIRDEAIEEGLASCRKVPGRLERVDARVRPAVFVDYAHTDHALANVLGALKPLTRGKLLVVFGCGGDRDRGKRPLMGAAVARGADLAVVTSDNPRSEDPDAILQAILPGLDGEGWRCVAARDLAQETQGAYVVISDRRQAIEQAILAADADDVVLIAGKGHENYQIVGDSKTHFDDREEAQAVLRRVGSKEPE